MPSGPVGAVARLWVMTGWLGVDLFFVLSGYLVGGLLLDEYRRHGTIRPARFLVRRGLKIYPLYLTFLAYLVAMPTLKAALRGDAIAATAWAEGRRYWANYLFVQNYWWTPAGHTWTLAVEEHFYLALPFAVLLITRRNLLRWLPWLCLLLVPLAVMALRLTADGVFAELMSATHLRIDALVFGVGLRALPIAAPAVFAWLGRWRPALVAIGLLCWSPVLVVGHERPRWFLVAGLAGTYLGAACFLVAAVHTRRRDVPPAAVRVARGIGWIGVYSYGIYLWHITAMGIIDGRIGAPLTAGWSPESAWLARMALIVVAAITAGVVLTRLVERPALQLRDRWFPSRTLQAARTGRSVEGVGAAEMVNR